MALSELETKCIEAMVERKFMLTPKQIIAIFDAGRRRGSDEATAYEWGSCPDRDRLAELEAALVWQDDCGLTTDMDYDQKLAWWAAFKASAERDQ